MRELVDIPFVVIIFGGSVYIPKRYGFIVNITFNRDKKAFPYRESFSISMTVAFKLVST